MLPLSSKNDHHISSPELARKVKYLTPEFRQIHLSRLGCYGNQDWRRWRSQTVSSIHPPMFPETGIYVQKAGLGRSRLGNSSMNSNGLTEPDSRSVVKTLPQKRSPFLALIRNSDIPCKTTKLESCVVLWRGTNDVWDGEGQTSILSI